MLENLELINTCLKYQCKEKQYVDDLRQELCLQLLEMDVEKLNKIAEEQHINAFISRIIWNSVHSSTSPFYRTFINPLKKARDITKYEFEEET